MNSNKKITILLPTRGRPELLEKSLKSLIDRASNPEDIEIMLGLDEDDTATIDYIKETIAPYLQDKGVEARANIFKPLGYENLHTYVNTLAGASMGEWLFFWNDDGIMTTEG
jgi:glycosyltransferase involved in cell wall biosynthesis